MNIIDSVNLLKWKIEPKPENGGKSKNFYPNEKDFLAINTIMEFVEKSLLDNEKNKDVRIQKLYLILFIIFLKEFECPIQAEKKINNLFNENINMKIERIKSLLEIFYIENSKDLKEDLTNEKIELNNNEIINAIKLNMNNLFTLKNV
jgi:hypothetical protein